MTYVNEHGDVFDLPHAQAINRARMDLLNRYLDEHSEIKTVLDVGCGAGYFSAMMVSRGLRVISVDARDNLKVDVPFFHKTDIETYIPFSNYDLALFFGILYHLENPMGALRNLSIIPNLLIETIVADSRKPIFELHREVSGDDQGIRPLVLIPSELALREALTELGYSIKPERVDHKEYRGWNKRRIALSARKP